MKKIKTLIVTIIAIVMASLVANSQEIDAAYIYADFSFDGNQLFLIKDNPRTEKEVRGLDWDLELGARGGRVGVYIFYGQFSAIDYQNYGAGLDIYVFKDLGKIDLSAGIYYSQVIREDSDGNHGSFTSWVSPRARASWWISENISLNLTTKYQGRGDINTRVFELAGGITFKSNR